MQADDPIFLTAYDPTWPEQFHALARPIRQAMDATAIRIDHIGSTAIPGLVAKPVIDVQISVLDFEPFVPIREPLEQLGYIWRADNEDRLKRYFRETPGTRRIHLHVRRTGSFSEQFSLLFRDFLRISPEIAADYEHLKQSLARRYRTTEERHQYTEAKRPFIWHTMEKAERWATQVGWIPGLSDG